jgi:HAD superfamily hydrolase (TIGR01509 family)
VVSWDAIDTVLLDMDGTLLDLHYDNTLWNELVPARYSVAHGISLDLARATLFTQMREIHGELNFYCLDHWANFTQLDIVGLHAELAHLIVYRPNAEAFLSGLQACRKRSLLVTNAHRDSLSVKDQHAQLVRRLDADVSCHDYGAPKEDPKFWRRLQHQHPYDPGRTLLIDDNAAVLDAAATSGISHLLTIVQPDSKRPGRRNLNHPAITDFLEIMPCE